jgi:hypothetical protein
MMERLVEPELLDGLPAADPRAMRARGDLRLVNRLMGNAGCLARALAPALRDGATIADLGAGDGSFMLRVARLSRAQGVRVFLVDPAQAVHPDTLGAFTDCGWHAVPAGIDALGWLGQSPDPLDAVAANLFVHHIHGADLARLFRLVSRRTRLFVACEPRRSVLSLAGSHGLRIIGCSADTHHDAVVSVRAGFRGNELSAAWPQQEKWQLQEGRCGPFGHRFVARRGEGL